LTIVIYFYIYKHSDKEIKKTKKPKKPKKPKNKEIKTKRLNKYKTNINKNKQK
jgi:hypothetical protein